MSEQTIHFVNALVRGHLSFLVQSSILIAAALLLARFTVRTSAVRAAIYWASLVAVAALPVAAVLMSGAGVGFISLPFRVESTWSVF